MLRTMHVICVGDSTVEHLAIKEVARAAFPILRQFFILYLQVILSMRLFEGPLVLSTGRSGEASCWRVILRNDVPPSATEH